MPIVHVQMLSGRSAEQKRMLVSELTRAMVEVVGAVSDRVYVVIEEVEAENWARGGVPLALVDGGGVGDAA